MSAPGADREAMLRFVEALFRYADNDGYVLLRAFCDGTGADGAWRRDLWQSIKLNGGGLLPVVDAAVGLAKACAAAPDPVVFAAPIASFGARDAAGEKNLANGLVLTVECDQQPEVAKARLTHLLGQPTIAVESGGIWTDPATGETLPKLHLHWRLTEPTRSAEDHARLKEARQLAASLVGADQSAAPPCHPLRWPGSWHRKGEPRLARIVKLNPNAEIELGDALERLREVVAASAEPDGAAAETSEPEANPRDIAGALSMIPNDDLDWHGWNRIGMATWRASGGSDEGFKAFDGWSGKSRKYDRAPTRARWDHYFSSPPTQIGAGTLFHLARQHAPGWQKPSGKVGKRPIIDPGAPYEIARLIIDGYARKGHPLRHYRDSFYGWAGGAYAETADADIRAVIYPFLAGFKKVDAKGKVVPVRPNSVLVSNVFDALRAAAIVPSRIEPPAWLGSLQQPPADEMIACDNGLLHLPAGALLPHTPEYFTLNALRFAYDPAAPRPCSWLNFLDELWPNDPDAIETLQELFGYCLTANTRHQKVFLIVGPPRSGKGTIARVLTELVGKANTVSPTLTSLSTNFGLAPLIGKRVAIVSDARLSGRADQQVIVERLLSISGEDAQTIDRKYLGAWTGRLQTKFLILSNELPRLVDASGALVNRIILLNLTRSFLGHEDPALIDRLLAELPGILNWAIAGWTRLAQRKHFIQPQSGLDAVRQLSDLTSPITAFIRDECDTGGPYTVEANALFNAWCKWCHQQGRDHPGNAQSLGRDLRAAVPGLKVTQSRSGATRRRYYQGIKLK